MTEPADAILIVDPDPAFSAALAIEAQAAGLRAVCCRNWWEAKPLIDGRERIACLLVDLVQPDRMPNGLSVALMARARRGSLPVVFTSTEPDLLALAEAPDSVCLPKQAGPGRLIACTKEMIDRRTRTQRPLPQTAIAPSASLPPLARYRLDSALRFRSVNDTALVLWRKDRSQLIGHTLHEALPQVMGHSKLLAHLQVLSTCEEFKRVVPSAILHCPISLHIVRARTGLRVDFAVAA